MSYWLKDRTDGADSASQLPCGEVDVVIIGGGITGVSTALHIVKNDPSKTCVILEKHSLSSGATGCNGGFICPGTSERYSLSVDRYGLEATRELFQYTVSCTEEVKKFIEETKTDCELRFHGSVMLAFSEEELAELKVSYEQLSSYGVEVHWWDAATCKERTNSCSFLGGMFKPMAGQLWAAKLVYSIAEQAQRLGVKVCTHTAVLGVENSCSTGGEETSRVITVRTNRGTVRTRNVVYCTNAWTRDLLPELNDIIIPVRNQVNNNTIAVSLRLPYNLI